MYVCVFVLERGGVTGSSRKFILNSHLHSLTRGNYNLKKTSMLLTLRINQLLFGGDCHIRRKWIRILKRCFQLSSFSPYLLWCLNQ